MTPKAFSFKLDRSRIIYTHITDQPISDVARKHSNPHKESQQRGSRIKFLTKQSKAQKAFECSPMIKITMEILQSTRIIIMMQHIQVAQKMNLCREKETISLESVLHYTTYRVIEDEKILQNISVPFIM